jgi:hypothetical protein
VFRLYFGAWVQYEAINKISKTTEQEKSRMSSLAPATNYDYPSP